MSYNKELVFAKQLALKAGKIMLRYFEAGDIGTKQKSDDTPLTIADTKINRMVIEEIKKQFSDHGILGEEESLNIDAKSVWICDPIDGTWLFAAGVPLSVFCLALVVDGQPEIAVVYDPYMDRLYSAIKGKGAYENNKRLDIYHNSAKTSMAIFLEVDGAKPWSIFADPKISGKIQTKLHQLGHTTAYYPMGYSEVMVAAGRFDGLIISGKSLWDLVPGGFIAQEAGAKVTDIFGNHITNWSKNIKGLCAASPQIHNELLGIIKPILKDQVLQ